MKGAELYLGLDVGTQGTKALVADGEGRVLARASRAYGLLPGLPRGAAEQHPETWIGALSECCADLWRGGLDPARVVALGVSGQQHGAVLLDAQGAVIRPAKLWCDTSSAAEARELSAAWGQNLPVGYTASKLLWLARHEPQEFARLAHLLLPHDYVNWRLTGCYAMEAGDASGTGCFDPAARRFDPKLLRAIDARLEGCLPALLGAGQVCGVLDARGAALTGLARGTLVASGSGDNMASALGSGATRPGVAVLSLGTSATIFAYSARPVIDPEGLIAPFCDATGGYLPLLCVMNATGVFAEVRALCQAQDSAGLERLTRAAAEVEAGCDGLLWLPYLVGERVPDLPFASGALFGLRPGLLREGHLARAALEGVSLNLAWGLERLRALGVEVNSLRLVGGGGRNLLWRQILADVLELRVTALEEPESAALGAALLAIWTCQRREHPDLGAHEVLDGLVRLERQAFEPDARRAPVYRAAGARFRELAARVFDARDPRHPEESS